MFFKIMLQHIQFRLVLQPSFPPMIYSFFQGWPSLPQGFTSCALPCHCVVLNRLSLFLMTTSFFKGDHGPFQVAFPSQATISYGRCPPCPRRCSDYRLSQPRCAVAPHHPYICAAISVTNRRSVAFHFWWRVLLIFFLCKGSLSVIRQVPRCYCFTYFSAAFRIFFFTPEPKENGVFR